MFRAVVQEDLPSGLQVCERPGETSQEFIAVRFYIVQIHSIYSVSPATHYLAKSQAFSKHLVGLVELKAINSEGLLVMSLFLARWHHDSIIYRADFLPQAQCFQAERLCFCEGIYLLGTIQKLGEVVVGIKDSRILLLYFYIIAYCHRVFWLNFYPQACTCGKVPRKTCLCKDAVFCLARSIKLSISGKELFLSSGKTSK